MSLQQEVTVHFPNEFYMFDRVRHASVQLAVAAFELFVATDESLGADKLICKTDKQY